MILQEALNPLSAVTYNRAVLSGAHRRVHLEAQFVFGLVVLA